MSWFTLDFREKPTKLRAEQIALESDPHWKKIRTANKLKRAKDRANVRTWPDGRRRSHV